jgi:hypothetical protein
MAMRLPQTEEKDHFGSPSYRVKGKIFAQLTAEGDSKPRGLVKLSSAYQAALTVLDPHAYLPAPHWGRYGWTYVDLAAVDESTYADLLDKSWRSVAPRQLVVAHGGNGKTKARTRSGRRRFPQS